MADLIARGQKHGERWQRQLLPDQLLVLGREAGNQDVPWERFLSHRHAELRWRDCRLEVRRLPTGRNPLFLRGQEANEFQVKPGEYFVLGTTTFTVSGLPITEDAERPAILESTISAPELQRLQFRNNAPHRLDVLTRLPEVISGAADDEALFPRLVNMLLAGIPSADAVALVGVLPEGRKDGSRVEVLHQERRLTTTGAFQPSERLVLEAARKQQTEVRVWVGTSEPEAQGGTLAGPCSWAFCTPVRGESGSSWSIYVAGRFAADTAETLRGPLEISALGDDLKFTELVGAILSSLRQVQSLQRKQASLSQFFSPAVLRTLAEGSPDEVLMPREAEVTVLFCDLRGFSREAERQANNLLAMLNRVSQALGGMTQNILDQGGVIGDFHGDAAMGFWGWPIPQPDAVERACLAALGIRRFFEAIGAKPGHPLAGFEAGLGIATGRGVAGKIGTTNQVKVTVFGPVVNLASRLEGMTRILRAPILLDENTARVLAERNRPDLGRLRRVAKVKPYGLDTALEVTELLPPQEEYPLLTDAHLADYATAYQELLAGKWGRAYEMLRKMPPEDPVQDFLSALIIKHGRQPPPGWTGVIELDRKS